MKLILLFFSLAIGLFSSAQTIVNKGGTIATNETWTADTVKVTSDITVNDGVTLTINQGVCVEFQGTYSILVNGTIIAEGSEQKRIKFTPKNKVLTTTTGGWQGIRFLNLPVISTDTSIFKFCVLEYANGLTVPNTYGGAMYIRFNNIKLINNIFQKCQAKDGNCALYIKMTTPVVFGNLIVDNYGGGIVLDNCAPKILNCTIAGNGQYGIRFYQTTTTIIENCIIANNAFSNLYGTGIIKYSNVLGATLTTNGNIDTNPLFVGSGVNPYALKQTSPCLNAGKDNWTIDSCKVASDIAGNPRIYSASFDDIIDMGAYEYQGDPPPSLTFNTNSTLFIKAGGLLIHPLATKSVPRNYTYTFLSKPANLIIQNDTIKWQSTIEQAGETAKIEIIIANGAIKDTLITKIYVLKSNELIELPSTDATWSGDTIKVFADITVKDGTKLTINPGVCVEFQGPYMLLVDGVINAKGTALNKIKFTSKDKVLTANSGGWHGIRFNKAPVISTDTSIIENCILEYGNGFKYGYAYGGAVFIRFNKVKIVNSIIRKSQSSSDNCAIYIKLTNPQLIGNLIADNYGSGICLDNSSSNIENNTIAGNGLYGVYLYYSNPIVKNCIVSSNNISSLYSYQSTPFIQYSNFKGSNLSTNGNIDKDPIFDATSVTPYTLKQTSPCINAGKTDWTIDSCKVATDIAGNTRIYSASFDDIIDMGAYEYQGDPTAKLTFDTISKPFVKSGSLFIHPLAIKSVPRNYTYIFLSKPANLIIEHDTIKWQSTVEQGGETVKIEILIDNGAIKDTLKATLYVLKSNELIELPSTDATWSGDTIKVYADITVKDGTKLTINPGVCVEFQGSYMLLVDGVINAKGTALNKIKFTSKDKVLTANSGGWHGIRFNKAPLISTDTSIIENCILEYGNGFKYGYAYGGAVFIRFNKVKIVNSIIRKSQSSSDNCAIYIKLTNPLLIGNLIADNYGSGICLDNSSSNIANNTIAGNGSYGVYLYYSNPIVKNCIVSGNNISSLYSYQSTPFIQYSNFKGSNLSTNGNIDKDPIFDATGVNPYALKQTSPCVNAGKYNWTIDSCKVAADIAGNPRIYTASLDDIIDMGAYEYQGDPTPKLAYDTISKLFVKGGGLFKHALAIKSTPRNVTYTFLSKPADLIIENDTIKWRSSVDQAGTKVKIEILIDNGVIKDTLKADVYVLKSNEYYELLNMNETWSADTVKVFGDLTVKDGGVLTINPGVYVEFQGPYMLLVDGVVKAKGTADKRITFTAKNKVLTSISGGWHGVRYKNFPVYSNDTSIFEYCILEYGNGFTNGNAYGGVFFVRTTNKVKLINSIIRKSQSAYDNGAVYIKMTTPILLGNLFVDNFGSGIVLDECSPTIINCTFANNKRYGIHLYKSSPSIKNCITVNNSGGSFSTYQSTPSIYTSNIAGVTTKGNIDKDPKFVGNGKFPYALSQNSPCINAGSPIGSNNFSTDQSGQARLAYNTFDMGAYEYNGSPIKMVADTLLINENLAVDKIIDTINYTYLLNSTLSFSIIKNTTNSAFKIDNAKGILSVNNATDLDFEIHPIISISIRLADETYADTLNLSIKIADIGEFGINSFKGEARSGAVSFVIDSTVYIGLGVGVNTAFNDFWKFKHSKNVWEPVANFPGEPRADAEAFVIDGKAYVGIGYNKFSKTDFVDFYCYNPIDNTWTKMSDFGGKGRSKAISFALNSNGYIGTGTSHINGYNDEQFNDFWKFDAQLNTWTKIVDATTTARYSGQGFALNGKGYISGGMDANGAQLSDMQEYDPESATWSERLFADGLNLSVNDASVIAEGNNAFICYGNKKQVVSYNPKKADYNSVSNIGDLLELQDQREGAISFVLNDIAYFGLGIHYGSFSDNWASYYHREIVSMNLPFNYSPTDILLGNDTIIENNENGSLVGIFRALDKNAGDHFTYEITLGDYGIYIEDSNLLAHSLDYELQNNYPISVKVIDDEGNTYEKVFNIRVNDKNEAPTYISITNENVVAGSTIGSLIGKFITQDEDTQDYHAYSFDSNEESQDTVHYSISRDSLLIRDIITDEKPLHSLFVQSIDKEGLSITREIILTIEPGVGIWMIPTNENQFSIYPNPAKDQFTIQSLKNEYAIQELVLLNIDGKMVVKKQFEQTTTEVLDVSEFKAGIYYLVIKTKQKQLVQKIVIQ